MEKAVITILGTIGGHCDRNDNAKGIYNKDTKPAKYNSKIPKIKTAQDINTFPILIKNLSKEYEIVALHTNCAKEIQAEVIKNDSEIKEFEFKDEWKIDDDTEFDEIFNKIDNLMSDYDKVIIDVSHGFRHLPILLIVNVIIHNIEDINKIEMILFAKEIKKQEEYEFIDLKRYLDLANIAYALTTFVRNYTVANNVKVKDENFQKLLNDLSDFSQHILANSLDELLRGEDNLVEKILNKIDQLLRDDNNIFKNIDRLLEKTREHLSYFQSLKEKKNYEMLFYIAQEMYKKGYLLNSATLLSEALGMYCTWGLKKIDPKIKEKIDEYEKRAFEQKDGWMTFKLYELYNQAKIIYIKENYKYSFLLTKKDKNWDKSIEKEIKPIIEKENLFNEKLKKLSSKCDREIRNNLAHANTAKRLSDVKKEIRSALDQFKSHCIENDVLGVNK